MTSRPIPWHDSKWPPREWQAKALPIVIDGLSKRVAGIVSAVMGAGKSVFLAEVVRLALYGARDRAIVVTAPSARLVEQLAETISDRVGAGRVGVFYGRKKQPTRDVIVACNPSLGKLGLLLNEAGRGVALLVVDEAHKSEAANVRDVVPAMAPTCLLGMTATPFRSVPKECLSLFSEIFYRYTLKDAVRDGVLVPFRVESWGGDAGVLVDDACVDMIRQHANGPGIVSASGIDDAVEYAAWLSERGVKSKAVHSKMTKRRQEAVISELKSGEIDVAVHVSLLAEGVDFPWLRWICLRRHVQARVRFLQEIGRVGRSHPGKTEGLVLDPHLLLGKHGWSSTEAIADAIQQAADAEAEDGAASARGPMDPKEEEAVALDSLLVHVGAVRDALEDYGICSHRNAGAAWRLAPATEAQAETIRKTSRLTRHIPRPHKGAVKAVAKVPFALTKGQASDVLDILTGGFRWACSLETDEPIFRRVWSDSIVDDVGAETWQCKAVERWGNRASRAAKRLLS